ncbi:hypothetical protein [Rhodoferax ferrireducens]|uniref:hypothetical protein n=1 Tax=Rhodoferax ferrireducens TaxID=192843 RepID=UPI0018E59F30|nr:hypothetical protein [Rhodoferax ferrireducens]
MFLCKTDKARDELATKSRTLSQRERAALLMADGVRTRSELRVLLQCDDELIEKLVVARYLQSGPRPGAVPLPAEASAAPVAPVAKHSTDNFDGKRSLATTRMFLFDIGERMFARLHPDKALWFREQLREARDRDSMLSVARDMISAVEEIAGFERADSLSERIAMLLPPEG